MAYLKSFVLKYIYKLVETFLYNNNASQEYLARCGWSTHVSPLIKITEWIGNTITWMSVPRWDKVDYDFLKF